MNTVLSTINKNQQTARDPGSYLQSARTSAVVTRPVTNLSLNDSIPSAGIPGDEIHQNMLQTIILSALSPPPHPVADAVAR